MGHSHPQSLSCTPHSTHDQTWRSHHASRSSMVSSQIFLRLIFCHHACKHQELPSQLW